MFIASASEIAAWGALAIAVIGAITSSVIQIMTARQHTRKLDEVKEEFNGNTQKAVKAAADASVVAVNAAFARGKLAEPGEVDPDRKD